MRRTLIAVLAIAAMAMVSPAVASGPPVIRKATLTTQSAATGLDGVMRQLLKSADDPAWVGYEVPSLPGRRMYCGDLNRHDCICRLESKHQSYSQTSDDDSAENPTTGAMIVLLRLEDNCVDKICCYSSFCELDAGGLHFYWLDQVRPSESVALLESIIDQSRTLRSDRDVVDEAISAIAFHSDAAAAPALERMVESSRPANVRKPAVFWIGQNGGDRSVETLKRLLADDPDHDVRESAIFALSCCDMPGALEALVHTAREDDDPGIRSNALFWLANKAGAKSENAIADAAKDDPDAHVKEQAVFALSQLPKERGVPLLIDVARTNRSAEIRKNAIFWLGQSDDPRALDFFEELLTR